MSGINNPIFPICPSKGVDTGSDNNFLGNITFEGDVDMTNGLTIEGGTLIVKGPMTTPSAGELTIAAGEVTATGVFHTIDTQGDAGTDNLDTINGFADGMRIFVRATNGARTVVVKHNTGNIFTFDAADITLDETRKMLEMVYDATLSRWVVIGHRQVDATANAGRLIDVQTFTSSGSWVKPAGTASVETEVVGGGGGGGASASDNGSTGGTSSFGSHCQATGGAGGDHGAVGAVTGDAAIGGVGSSGDQNTRGQAGGPRSEDDGDVRYAGGTGGSSTHGGGGPGRLGNTTSTTAPATGGYGGGGGGGAYTTGDAAGDGGAGGGTATKYITAGLGASETITVGSGGAGGSGGGSRSGGTGAPGIVIVKSYT